MMMQRLVIVLCLGVFLSACQSSPKASASRSGFLTDYNSLKPVVAEDGTEVLRSIDPRIKEYNFESILLEAVMISSPESFPEFSLSTLQEMRVYFDTKLRSELKKNHRLIDSGKENTPRVRIALTGVKLKNEGLKATEILPFGAAIGLLRTATGTRNKEVTVLVEVQIEDSLSGEPLAAIVRAGEGNKVRTLWQSEISMDHIRPALDEWVGIATDSFGKLIRP